MVSETNSVNDLNSNNLQLIDNDQIVTNKITQSDPQVKATNTPKRKFTNGYKLKILTTFDACSNALERGALLRREGLYHSSIAAWRNQLGMSRGGGKKNTTTTKIQRTDHMVREIEQLKKKLAQAQAIIDLQKKVSELLGTHILSHESSEEN